MGHFRKIAFGDGVPAPAGDLCHLHHELLPHSPVVLLGRPFIEEFYYGELPQMGLMTGVVAYYDDIPIGFIAVTDDSDGFMGHAIRRRPLRLAWVLMKSVVTDPRRIKGLLEAHQIMRARVKSADAEPIAELLSFAVLREYRSPKFVSSTGTKVGRELFEGVMRGLEGGPAKIKALVDKTNLDVKLMYRALGWVVHDDDVAGWKTPQVEFRLDLAQPSCDS